MDTLPKWAEDALDNYFHSRIRTENQKQVIRHNVVKVIEEKLDTTYGQAGAIVFALYIGMKSVYLGHPEFTDNLWRHDAAHWGHYFYRKGFWRFPRPLKTIDQYQQVIDEISRNWKL